jgi:nucleoside-diphosphate-sugar epimerase
MGTRTMTLQDVCCVVLGGGGFIDTNLCRALGARDAIVHGFRRRQNYSEALRGMLRTQGSAVRKFVLVSSGGIVYGMPSRLPFPETAQTNFISACGISKLTVEKYLHLYRHLHYLNFVVLHVSNPYGPFQSPTRPEGIVAVLMHKDLEYGWWRYGEQGR